VAESLFRDPLMAHEAEIDIGTTSEPCGNENTEDGHEKAHDNPDYRHINHQPRR